MNRRRAILLAIFGLVLASTAVILFWPRQSGYPGVRLRVIRRVVEKGNPVAYFKIEDANNRLTRIIGVTRFAKDQVDDPFESSSGIMKPTKGFWAAEAEPMGPMANPSRARKEFGVFAPQGASIWKLRVVVESATVSSPFERFKAIPRVWRMFRDSRYSFSRALRATWGVSVNDPSYVNHAAPMLQIIESDPITNAVTPEVTK